MDFEVAYAQFFQELGKNKIMVLSTSFQDVITSRSMSIVILNYKFYFQTDKTFRKYGQLHDNPNVALCIDNIQIEGKCKEIGKPCDHKAFSDAYKEYFINSYNRYTNLENERLFEVLPTFIERWKYLEGIPYVESFHIENKVYCLKEYIGR